TVMQDALGRFDDCQQGSVCLTDVATGLLQCQQVCRTDVDCTGQQRTRCAQLVTNTTEFGICMPPCTYANGSGAGDCMGFNNSDMSTKPPVSCHFAGHVPAGATATTLDGVCRFDGQSSNGLPCDETLVGSSCSAGTYCANGVCNIMCTAQATCTVCVDPISGDKSGNGYCQ
ncbi:MAG: hypothetical protein ABI321_12500, partial [Polyangia bacterium]